MYTHKKIIALIALFSIIPTRAMESSDVAEYPHLQSLQLAVDINEIGALMLGISATATAISTINALTAYQANDQSMFKTFGGVTVTLGLLTAFITKKYRESQQEVKKNCNDLKGLLQLNNQLISTTRQALDASNDRSASLKEHAELLQERRNLLEENNRLNNMAREQLEATLARVTTDTFVQARLIVQGPTVTLTHNPDGFYKVGYCSHKITLELQKEMPISLAHQRILRNRVTLTNPSFIFNIDPDGTTTELALLPAQRRTTQLVILNEQIEDLS